MGLNYIKRKYSLKSSTDLKIGRQYDKDAILVEFTDFELLSENSIVILNVDYGGEKPMPLDLFENKYWLVPRELTEFQGTMEGQLIELLLGDDNKTIIQQHGFKKFYIRLSGSIPLTGEFTPITAEFELWINQYKDDHKNIVSLMDSIQAKLDNGDLKGEKGDDGVSPTIQSFSITGGTQVVVTDKDGSKTFIVRDGEQGIPGKDGKDAEVTPEIIENIVEQVKEEVPPYDDTEIKEELNQQSQQIVELMNLLSQVRDALQRGDVDEAINLLDTFLLDEGVLG